ncbi:Hypothetical protein CINCED_3A019103 [Cinara cedri]|uniref:Serpin domain-containing protein n=1 Tax=Cinara cedri TaxID=506608 RepID=A0A5E4LXQ3_9HEMI|nr:Hypothetical protein CINCED_3A019103 [Cinara cedri]
MICIRALVGLCILQVAVSGQSVSKSSETLTGLFLKATSGENFNYVSAPFAGSAILALAAEGAEAGTKSQLIDVLGGELPDKNSYKEMFTSIKGYPSDGNWKNKVVLKNFLYVYKNYSVLESFAELARENYLTEVKSVTRPNLEIPGTAEDTSASDTAFKEHAMLIFNGFSLEMSWPTSTWHRTSLSWNGNVVRAFGAAGNFAIGQIPLLDSTVFQLPYKNTDYALLVILPKSKESYSFDEIIEKLQKDGIKELTKNLVMKPAFVTMPCFHSSNITSMKTVLQETAQVKDIFSDSAADLSKLSSDNLYLDDVVQQAGVRVCIDGATSYSLTSSAFTAQRVIKESVVVDRPFMYALYNVANGVVFVAGKLDRPVWEETDDAVDSDIETIKL